MIHLYHGDGKGKTTAAVGLAVRAAGSGMRVLFVQLLKDGASSEIKTLSSIPGITVFLPELYFGWCKNMTEEQKTALKECYDAAIRDIANSAFLYEMIVLDEAVGAYRHGLLDSTGFLSLLKNEKDNREIVMTGRCPAPELTELADYVTQMQNEKHPFDSGVTARKGIEY